MYLREHMIRFKQRTSLPLVLSLLILMVTSGCEIFGSDSGERSDLETQKRIWNAYNSGDYSFLLQRGCFCIYDGQFEIQVRDNTIADIIPPWDDQEGVPKEDWQYFHTISELFDLLEDAFGGEADKVDVEYSEFGYPVSIDIDYAEMMIDDELFLGVSEVVMSLE